MTTTTWEELEAQVGVLPPEVKDLGCPEGAYPSRDFSLSVGRSMLLIIGCSLAIVGGVGFFGSLNHPAPKDGPSRETLLGVEAGVLLLGVLMSGAAFRRPSGGAKSKPFQGFLVYPTGVVQARAGRCTVLPWEKVEAVISPERGMGPYQILTADGLKIPVEGIKGARNFLQAIVDRFKGEWLDRARARIAAGETVAFSPFGVSAEALEYKGKRLAWDDMSVFEVALQQGHRYLRVKRRGTIWPWCYRSLYGTHNEPLFFLLVEEVRSARPYVWN